MAILMPSLHPVHKGNKYIIGKSHLSVQPCVSPFKLHKKNLKKLC